MVIPGKSILYHIIKESLTPIYLFTCYSPKQALLKYVPKGLVGYIVKQDTSASNRSYLKLFATFALYTLIVIARADKVYLYLYRKNQL